MFESVKSNKISEHITEQIRKAIFEGRLKPGDKLPSEKQLMETFQVSKASLREALRSLEVLGFLEIRKGATGGSFVTEVDMEKARTLLINFLHFKNLSLQDLSEVRLILEPYVAEKAALAIAEEQLDNLRKLNEESEHLLKNGMSSKSRENEIAFHRIIGAVTGNPILMFILEFVEHLLIDAKDILQPGKEFSERVLAAHKSIYEALSERNPGEARKEMIRHVQEVAEDLFAIQEERDLRRLSYESRGALSESGIFSRERR